MSLAGVIVMCAVFWGVVALARSWPRSAAASYRRPAARSGHEPRTHYRSPPDPADRDPSTRAGSVYEYRDRTLDVAALRAMRDRSVLRDRSRG